MDDKNQNTMNTQTKSHQHGIIHIILFHTYVLFLASVILGVLFDQFYPHNLFSNKEFDIGDYSDWEMIDSKHYCPDCYEVEVINGVYNVKAKEK